MAIEREIPKDIKQYEPKLLGPFTARQLFCMVPAVLISLGVYIGLKNYLSSDIRLLLLTIVDVPFILVGWFKPYGLPFEKFAKTVFCSLILSPPFRKYKTERMDANITVETNTNKGEKKSKKKRTKIEDPLLQPHK